MAHPVIEKARNYHKCNIAFPFVQSGDFSFPGSDTEAAKDWLEAHGYLNAYHSGDRWVLACGMQVTDSGVVFLPRCSNL
ncbi:MAG: hypothetical protein KGL39_42815 [Patescibacteria group bacterium]|nr:hypothetical protein [Patescibacteria group bacterium]